MRTDIKIDTLNDVTFNDVTLAMTKTFQNEQYFLWKKVLPLPHKCFLQAIESTLKCSFLSLQSFKSSEGLMENRILHLRYVFNQSQLLRNDYEPVFEML